MKTTIITVCYNSAATIRDTFESVLNQNYYDIDYIVVDGNSNDETVLIIKEYEQKFKGKMRWISENDKGLYDAMNKGIKMAYGEIIGILNSDDYYASNNVLSLVINAIKEKNIDSCYGNLLYIKNNKPYRYWRSGQQKSFKFGWMPPHPSLFVKRSVYEKYGYFRLDCGYAADYELMLRFFEKIHISTYWINELFVKMRVGGASNKRISSRINAYNDDKTAWVVNNLKPYYFTLILKKISKIPQYLYKIIF
jgi:glycosyltransferase involved in cell wall biosynthesis